MGNSNGDLRYMVHDGGDDEEKGLSGEEWVEGWETDNKLKARFLKAGAVGGEVRLWPGERACGRPL